MAEPRRNRVGLLWTQFSAYHIDRCMAVATRLKDAHEVLAVEVATASALYAWDPSGAVAGATKVTLFPGRSYDDIAWFARFRAQFRVLRTCRAVFVGISYAEPDIILLSLCLRLVGVRVVLMTESKFDDRSRRVTREFGKSLILLPYVAALVGGDRQEGFVRFLGFGRRKVVQGYDTVDLDRVRNQAGVAPASDPGSIHTGRPFVFVGRFVAKKAVPFLIDCYRRYRELAGDGAHGLVLVGSGEMEGEVRERIERYGLGEHVIIPGFLQAEGVSRTLAGALTLILPSTEEQWGLVVNEAMAFHLPIIVSENVGSRDLLVRNLVNGFVVENGSVEGFARAMLAISDEATWRRMAAASAELAPNGHTDRFADAVAALIDG